MPPRRWTRRSVEPNVHQPTRFERDEGPVNDREAAGVDEEVEDGLGRSRDLDVVSDLHGHIPFKRVGGAATNVALIARKAHRDVARGGTVSPMSGHWRAHPVADDCVTPCDRTKR